ncbi:MAG TPA: MBL fold metallo-hydrolase [Candidatus Limnocylindrales bacterium]|nr:MBL fold metallo-hydrolase [Candidatus Limnocylindrales bacterium]
MLSEIADGVQLHVSDFLQSNSVVVEGASGVLLIDPGITNSELGALANDISEADRRVEAGFATHPHWDHLLWHPALGVAPRYATARCAADIDSVLSDAGWRDRVAEVLPPDIADQIPMDLLGLVTGLPAAAARIPWDGTEVRIIEHRAHAIGHAALLIAEPRVLVAGDMLSDILMPFLDLEAADPIEDYLVALRLFEGAAGEVDVVVPGHGSVGGTEDLRERIAQDRAYVEALRDGVAPEDPRLDPSGPNGDWLLDVHEWQVQQLSGSADDS